VTNLWGKVSKLSGTIHPDLYGNVSRLKGDITGIWGNCTGKFGDLSECHLTEEERAEGINIEDLVEK
jgi:hypothetical protein